jgi:hypothetical protein
MTHLGVASEARHSLPAHAGKQRCSGQGGFTWPWVFIPQVLSLTLLALALDQPTGSLLLHSFLLSTTHTTDTIYSIAVLDPSLPGLGCRGLPVFSIPHTDYAISYFCAALKFRQWSIAVRRSRGALGRVRGKPIPAFVRRYLVQITLGYINVEPCPNQLDQNFRLGSVWCHERKYSIDMALAATATSV